MDSRATIRRWLLLAGLIGGIAAAAVGMVTGVSTPGTLPDSAVASINGRIITRDAWLRAVAAIASERRTPLTRQDKQHILDRLVDEELLVQHGVALGLIEEDRRLRGQLVADVMASVTTGVIHEFDEAAERRFYAAHQDFFTPPARLKIEAFRVGQDGQRADFSPPLPDALLPAAALRNYLGPGLTQVALKLRPGETSAPVPYAQGYAVLRLVASEPSAAPPFEQVAQQVRQEMRRRADEEAARELLDQLRRNNDVIVRSGLQ